MSPTTKHGYKVASMLFCCPYPFYVSSNLRSTARRIATSLSTPYFRGIIPESLQELVIYRVEQLVFLHTDTVEDYLNTFRQALFSICMQSLKLRKAQLTVCLKRALDDLLSPGCARACVYKRK